jgi:hypothetical protein
LKELFDNHPNVVPLIWQGDTVNISPNYSQRSSFYGVNGIPHVQFNGYLADVGGGNNTYTRYLNIYNNQINIESPLELDVSLTMGENNGLMLHTAVSVTGEITTSNNRIVYLLTRNLSDSYFSSVVTYEYFDFPLTQVGEEQTFEYELPINQNWTYEELGIAVLIQTWDNDPAPNKHKIIQSRFHTFEELMIPTHETAIDFGVVDVNTQANEILQFTNFYQTAMSCMVIPVMGFSAEMLFTIEPQSTYDLEIHFTPTQAIDYYGEMIVTTDNSLYPSMIFTLTGTGYDGNSTDDGIIAPNYSALQQNYPNPFNPSTTIEFSLTELEKPNSFLHIFNISGQKLTSFDLSTNQTGSLVWDGKDAQDDIVPSGVYLYQLKTDKQTITKKMILMK